jgi:DNA replication ATP-dependent helicase Dna2
MPVALELKTGKPYAQAHNAQVLVYNLLMSDRYGTQVDKGLLFYLKSEEMSVVPSRRAEIVGIVMERNQIATHVRNEKGDARCAGLPPVIQQERMCKGCFSRDACFLYHRATEDGTAENSGVPRVWTETVGHLSEQHLAYFRAWASMIDDENANAHANQHELWTMSASSRERKGVCLGSLKVESVADSADSQKFLYSFLRCDASGVAQPLPPTGLSKGDFVVVSATEPRQKVAVATGIVQAVDARRISVVLGPKLEPHASSAHASPVGSQMMETLTMENGSTARWRIDKDELTTGVSLERSNLIKLFRANGHMHKLRKIIVDLAPPIFGGGVPFGGAVSLSGGEQAPLAATHFMGGRPGALTQAARQTIEGVNSEQQEAIHHVIRAQDYALILGMPGTGKTTTIARLVAVLVAQGQSVLLTAFTNTAVDNILLKLQDLGSNFIRLGRAESVHPDIRAHTIVRGALFFCAALLTAVSPHMTPVLLQ